MQTVVDRTGSTGGTGSTDGTGRSDPSAGRGGRGGRGTPSNRSASAVTNTSLNPAYAPFLSKLTRVADMEEKAGPIPKFSRTVNGTLQEVPACVGYQVRGNCSINCPRNADHVPHMPEQINIFADWLRRATE